MRPPSCPATTREIDERPYTGSVAVHPYTDENPAAHGNIVVTEECCACGAHRQVAQNWRHVEYSPWGPSRAVREQREREEQARLEREKQARILNDARDLLSAHGVVVLRVSPGLQDLELKVRGDYKRTPLEQIREAAGPAQGDELCRQVYSAMLIVADTL